MAVRKIQTELSLGGEKAFNDALKASNSNLKTIRSSMAAVSSEFRDNENSVQSLRAKQKLLTDQYKQQQEIVRALQERLAHVIEAYGEESAQADKLRQQLNAATVAMDKAKDAMDDNRKQMLQTIATLGRTGQAFKTLATGATEAFETIGKGAAALTGIGAAAVGTMAAIGIGAVNTLTDFAVDAAERSKDAYAKADELAEKAREAALAGNEEAAMEYLRQANALIDGIDAEYLRFSATLDNLSASSTAAKDALGKILLPALQSLGDEGAQLLQSFAADLEAASGDTERMGEIMAEYLSRAAELMREQIPEFGEIAVELIHGLADGLSDNLPELLDAVLGIVEYILQTIEEAAPGMGTAAAELISQLLSFLLENAPELLAAGVAIVAQIIAGLVQKLPDLIDEVLALPGKLMDAFRSVDIDWSAIGHNIVAGISEGFSRAWESFKASVTSAFDSLGNAIAGFLGIHSPSTWYRDHIGKNMAEGVGVGFEAEMPRVSQEMQRSLDEAAPQLGATAFNASVSHGAQPGGSTTSLGGVSIVINGYNVRDDKELAEILSYELEQILARRDA